MQRSSNAGAWAKPTRFPRKPCGTFKEMILRGGQGKRSTAAFEALRDIDLTVRRGEIVGVIGDNGSGKSTLLKLIGITAPTRGRLRVHGTVSEACWRWEWDSTPR